MDKKLLSSYEDLCKEFSERLETYNKASHIFNDETEELRKPIKELCDRINKLYGDEWKKTLIPGAKLLIGFSGSQWHLISPLPEAIGTDYDDCHYSFSKTSEIVITKATKELIEAESTLLIKGDTKKFHGRFGDRRGFCSWRGAVHVDTLIITEHV